MPETKLPCRLNRHFHGLAHIIETTYRGRPVWYGSIDLAGDWDQVHTLIGRDVEIALEDGRVGHARTNGCEAHRVEVAVDGREPGETCLLFFVGFSQLAVPQPIPHASRPGDTVITATRTIVRSNDGKTPAP